MALKIRLSRGGAKKRPFYRIVVADSRKPRDGRFIERLGTYNPMLAKDHPERILFNEERVRHWLSNGATPSDRVARFLGAANIVPAPAVPEQTKKNQPRAKTLERMKEAEEAARAKAEAEAAAAAEAAEAEAEAPAEEAPAGEAAAEEAPA
jgi:small subunit ribosomal protein S16